MDVLKKIFPFSFGAMEVKELVLKIVVYAIMALGMGLVLWVAGRAVGWLPVLGAMVGGALKLIAWSTELYLHAGIVLAILDYTKVI